MWYVPTVCIIPLRVCTYHRVNLLHSHTYCRYPGTWGKVLSHTQHSLLPSASSADTHTTKCTADNDSSCEPFSSACSLSFLLLLRVLCLVLICVLESNGLSVVQEEERPCGSPRGEDSNLGRPPVPQRYINPDRERGK